jgi:hypothetical protein
MRKLFTLIIICTSCASFCQSTDVVKLYILYDISGSTRIQDLHQNMAALASLLVQEKDGKSKSPFSIEFVAFGEETEMEQLNLYDGKNIAGSRASLIKYLNKVNDRSDNTPIQQYTHLAAALDTVKDKANFKESFGIFIFADGQLKPGDIKEGVIEEYNKTVQASINMFRSLRKPVYMIQSSIEMVNDYYEIPAFANQTDTLNVSNDFFWLSSNVNYDEKRSNKITEAFERFLLQAFFGIQNNFVKNPAREDTIGKFLVLAELLHYLKVDEKINKLNKEKKSSANIKLETMLRDSIKGPGNIDQKYDKGVIEKERPNLKQKESDRKSSRGGTRSLSSFTDKTLLPPPIIVPWTTLLVGIATKLDTARTIDRRQLESLQNEIKDLVNYPGFERVGAVLEKYKLDHKDDFVSNAQNISLGNFSVGSAPQPLNYSLPSETRQQNFQEALILGLTDYLIKRSKQEALFLSLEFINKKVFEPSSFIRDTLFSHTARLFATLDPENDAYFEPNLVLIKEAFNQDMDIMSASLIKHPHVHKSDGLVSLLYSTELINSLVRGNTFQASFSKLLKTLPVNSLSSSQVERGFLFVCHLIDFLEKYDLSRLYSQNSPGTLTNFSKILAIYIAKQYPDIHELENLEIISEKVQLIYSHYEQVKAQIEQYKNEIASLKPTGSFAEYQQYKRQITLQIIKSCAELLIAGVDVAEHYVNSDVGEIKKNINSLKTICNTALECWFLIENKKYAEAAAHLIPMIPDLPLIKIDTSSGFISKYGELRSSANLIALKNHSSMIKKVLNNKSLNFDKKLYDAKSKLDALDFIARNQLTFLSPLLLHEQKVGGLTSWEVKLPDDLSINNVLSIFDDAIDEFDKNSFKVKNLVSKIKRKAVEASWSASTAEHVMLQLLSYFSIDGIDDNLKKMMAIAGEASSARTAKEVENVIGKYALPVASYRIKRNSVHTWMVNAYVGGSGVLYHDKGHWGYSITAPVGIEHSWRSKGHKTSFSLFASVLDVGNVINYRINDSQGSDKTFLLENIVSPGLFGVFGLSKRFPFSVGAGYQFNPQRASIFVAFDLPLFRLR